MAIITEKSVFIHIGRTGGHWISDVLFRAELVKMRVKPLHIRPKELTLFYPATKEINFWYCFVRHPLNWIQSIWCHYMSYGLTDPTLSHVLDHSFEKFIQNILNKEDNEFCMRRIIEYTDACNFVGKQENLVTDFQTVLKVTNQPIEPSLLLSPPLNLTSLNEIKKQARASNKTLQLFMEKNCEYVKKYDYNYIPKNLISNEILSPEIISKIPYDNENSETLSVDTCSEWFDLPFHYPKESYSIELPTSVREYWGITHAAKLLCEDKQGSLLVYPAGDGIMLSHISVIFNGNISTTDFTRRHTFNFINSKIKKPAQWYDWQSLLSNRHTYDLALFQILPYERIPQLSFCFIAQLLHEGSEIIFCSHIIDLENYEAMLLALNLNENLHSKYNGIYCNKAALFQMAKYSGFYDFEVIDEYPDMGDEKGNEIINRLSKQFKINPDSLFKKLIIKAKYSPKIATDDKVLTSALNDMLMMRSPLFVTDPENMHPDAPVMRICRILKIERDDALLQLYQTKGALADREFDLINERNELVSLRKQISDLINENIALKERLLNI